MSEEWRPIGMHRVRTQDDVLFLELHGEYRLEDCKVIYPMLADLWAANPNAFAIIDSTNMTGLLSPEVRRFVGDFGRKHFKPEYRNVIVARSIVIRALAHMVVALSRIGRVDHVDVIFTATVPEAWQQIERMRRERP